MNQLKIIDGRRVQLEQELVKALFAGDMEAFNRINQRLGARASLSPCRDSVVSGQDERSAPRQSDEAPV
jgi:hypothetical protein